MVYRIWNRWLFKLRPPSYVYNTIEHEFVLSQRLGMDFPAGCNWEYPLVVSLKRGVDVLSWILGLILLLTLEEKQCPNYERFQVSNWSLASAKRFSGSLPPDRLWNLLIFKTKIQNMWINKSSSISTPFMTRYLTDEQLCPFRLTKKGENKFSIL